MSEERKPPDRSAPFYAMGERVEANASESFGGAFVIVPPGNGNDPVSFLTLDSRQDPAMFWANLKTIAELSLSELDERQRNPFGGVR